jgi:hypothetical protein
VGIVRNTIVGKAGDNIVDLPVVIAGMTIEVGAGNFFIGGNNYALFEAETFTAIASPSHVTDIRGYLVLTGDGESRLLVDEYVQDGESEPYAFTAEFKLLHRLFSTRLGAGATELGDVFWFDVKEGARDADSDSHA